MIVLVWVLVIAFAVALLADLWDRLRSPVPEKKPDDLVVAVRELMEAQRDLAEAQWYIAEPDSVKRAFQRGKLRQPEGEIPKAYSIPSPAVSEIARQIADQ